MTDNYYEKHSTNSDMPFVFHTDIVSKSGMLISDHTKHVSPQFPAHWHENIELLYVFEGECDVITNAVRIHARPGDIAVVNSNMVHKICSTTDEVKFNCLIIDAVFCKSFGIAIENTVFSRHISGGGDTEKLFLDAKGIIKNDSQHKILDIKLAILAIMINLVKFHTDEKHSFHHYSNPKAETVKHSINYMKAHFSEPITIARIADALGLTKCYFCHIFKEITGSTAISHLNYVRCKNARKLISSGEYNIREAAEMSGFTNMSYFAKTYKSITGQLPSETKSQSKQNK